MNYSKEKNKEIGYIPEFQSVPIKTHYESIGFFETLQEGFDALAKKRPKNAVKFLGNWLVENDKGLTVKPIARGSLFDQSDSGGYRATIEEKRKRRTREKFNSNRSFESNSESQQDRPTTAENTGRTLIIKKQVNKTITPSSMSKENSKEEQDKMIKDEIRAISNKVAKKEAKKLDKSQELSGLDSIQEEIIDGEHSDSEEKKISKNVAFKEDISQDYSQSKHLQSNDNAMAISENINTSMT